MDKNKFTSKELHALANDFLNSNKSSQNLPFIIELLKNSAEQKLNIGTIIYTLEVIFTQLFKRDNFKSAAESEDKVLNTWLCERYDETWQHLLNIIQSGRNADAIQALSTCFKLMVAESKSSNVKNKQKTVNAENNYPKKNLRDILSKLISAEQTKSALIRHFAEYAKYLDVVFFAWQQLLSIGNKQTFSIEIWALNYLELISAIPVTKSLLDNPILLCESAASADYYDYNKMSQYINRFWKNVMSWSSNMTEAVHKQTLIVLLERILPHLQKPILLTDFLMDSLECGGVISLLALQGVFTLIQKHNITYPKVYEKLYSLFEPEIFSTKYKARLFYLADIFLSSTHLPEALVAGFVKRLARLSLAAPPQDIIIIIYFIANLSLRHGGLKKLIRSNITGEVEQDPFVFEELKPENSNAIESSLWEIVLLQYHVLPNVAAAARSFVNTLPTTEWNLSAVLELDENDIFEDEIGKSSKQYALNFERPKTLFLPKDDKVQQYWNLF